MKLKMPGDHAIVNASPFIILSKAGLLDLLPGLFGKIEMPVGVADEIRSGYDIASEQLQSVTNNWLTIARIEVDKDVALWNLGNGETQVLSLARSSGAGIALIDDQAARRCAKTFGLPVMGTAGLLVLAKKRGFLSSVKDGIGSLEAAGLYLADSLRDSIITESGE